MAYGDIINFRYILKNKELIKCSPNGKCFIDVSVWGYWGLKGFKTQIQLIHTDTEHRYSYREEMCDVKLIW